LPPFGAGGNLVSLSPHPVGGFGRAQPSRDAGGSGLQAGAWGNQVSPCPHPREGVGGLRPPKNNRMFMAAWCGGAAWRANVNIRPRRGAWGNPVSPCPHPREGVGGLRPPKNNRMFMAAWCGGAAWRAEVTIVRSVPPPFQPPPAGGRHRVPAPSGGGSGRGPAPCPRSRGAGVPPALPGRLHRALCAPRMGPNAKKSWLCLN